MKKEIVAITTAGEPHMVGDGFRPRNFIDRSLWKQLNPFLLVDYNEPWQLNPTVHPRGVDVHPHKGFETVTIAWQGTLAHEDSSGGKGTIGKGDVQWMTAGSGILHKEFHEEQFSREGGILEMAQLWINLPAASKNVSPSYQDISSKSIPTVALDEMGSYARVIAGNLYNTAGPAHTHTPINVWDTHVAAGSTIRLPFAAGFNAAILLLKGHVMLNDEKQMRAGQMATLDNQEGSLAIEANTDSHLLVLSGEPINEPIAAYGPFVMNKPEEIQQALADYKAGKFGTLN